MTDATSTSTAPTAPLIPAIPMITVVIDGRTIEVPKGASIIEAADQLGVVIPRFCYHKKLSVAANCRMCLVDVEGSRKPTPACATPATDKMVIHTKSQKTLQYQKEIMEFLLINHPLDCPVCDQGGECELQDVALGYGKDISDFTEGKRAVPKKDIGPLIETDLTRCIHCTRCVRFGQEVSGIKELGMTGRGEHSEISSFLDSHIHSEMSGNIIDLCPVGALTSKPFRYQARAWELIQKPMIAPHDCVGSNLWGHIRRGKLMRVVPRENENLNETWISDRDRFSYEAVNSQARLTQPKIKKEGIWVTVSWTEALEAVVKRFHHIANTPASSEASEHSGMERVGALASPSSTLEELYLLQKFMRAIGSPHIDHRLHQHDDRQLHAYGTQPGLDLSLGSLQSADVILWIGSDVRTQQPILHHRLRQASLKGAKILMINPEIFERRFDAHLDWTVSLDHMQLTLAELLKAHTEQVPEKNPSSLLNSVTPSETAQQIIQLLISAKSPVLVMGEGVLNHPEASHSLSLFMRLKERLNAKGGILTVGSNTAGAFRAGAVPHQLANGEKAAEKGLSAKQMLDPKTQMRGYILLNTEPDLDSAFELNALQSLKQAEAVVALTAFETESLQNYAHIMLPISSFGETDGTFVSVLGDVQSFQAVSQTPGEARPAWKVLRVLANFFEVQGFEYESIDQVRSEVLKSDVKQKPMGLFDLPLALPTLHKLSHTYFTPSLYHIDMLTRQAPALQATAEAIRTHDQTHRGQVS